MSVNRAIELVDALDDVVHDAGGGKKVKVERERFYEILDELRVALGSGGERLTYRVPDEDWQQLARLFLQLDDMVHLTRPSFLSARHIRVEWQPLYALLDEMRPLVEQRAPQAWEERSIRSRTSEG